jgi:hypothetical protein
LYFFGFGRSVPGVHERSPDPAQATRMILSPAAGEVSEASLARWIRDNWPKT